MDQHPAVAEASDTALERQLRVDLAACYRLVAHFGWDDLLATHISVRVPGEGCQFLLNPYGLLFSEITASSLLLVNSDGEILSPSPYKLNPAGLNIHAAIHEVRHDPVCVIHMHGNAGVAVSALECGFLPLSQTAMTVYDDVAYHDYEGFATSRQEREHLQRDLGDKGILILRNHGTLVTGPSIPQAFVRTFFLERACEIQLQAQATGQKIVQAPREAVTITYKASVSDYFGQIHQEVLWPALIRMIDKKDNGYRT